MDGSRRLFDVKETAAILDHADAGAFDLPGTCLTADLRDHVVDHHETCRADRVALRDEAP